MDCTQYIRKLDLPERDGWRLHESRSKPAGANTLLLPVASTMRWSAV